MAAPVVSPVRGCGPDSGDRGPTAGKLMSLSHSLAADVLSRTSSNMFNNATESSRACGRAGVIPPFLCSERDQSLHDPALLIRQRWRSFRTILTGTRRLALSFVRQHGKIYMLEGFDESTSWFDRLMRRF